MVAKETKMSYVKKGTRVLDVLKHKTYTIRGTFREWNDDDVLENWYMLNSFNKYTNEYDNSLIRTVSEKTFKERFIIV